MRFSTLFLSTILLLIACKSGQKDLLLLPALDEVILKDLQKNTKFKKSMYMDTVAASEQIELSDSLLLAEFSFLKKHFDVSDKTLEGYWKKNTMVKDERNITEEYLGNHSNNPFESIIVKKRNAQIAEIKIISTIHNLLSETKYKLEWNAQKTLRYTIQKNDEEPIVFLYRF